MSTETNAIDIGKVKPEDNMIQLVEIDRLQEFKGHAFKPYKGKKMAQLTQSIRENGVMQPIIVRAVPDSRMFEIVSGHNRMKAAEQADLKIIPAIVREMSDDEAAILANETNVTQRSFKDWLPSEKAKSIHQYHEAIKRQGKRSAKNIKTSGVNSQRNDNYARAKAAKVYGVKENSIRLYLDIHKLTDALMDKLDIGDFGITAAQALAFISPAGQSLVGAILEEDRDVYKVTVSNSQKLRSVLKKYTGENADEEAKVEEKVRKLLDREHFCISESEATTEKVKNIPLEADLYEEWFFNQPVENAVEVIKAALESYFDNNADMTADKNDQNTESQALHSESIK